MYENYIPSIIADLDYLKEQCKKQLPGYEGMKLEPVRHVTILVLETKKIVDFEEALNWAYQGSLYENLFGEGN
jgi:hypothetical protein